MHITKELIEDDLKQCKDAHYRLSRRLNRIRGGSVIAESMTYSTVKGERYYAEIWWEEGAKKTKYLGKGDDPDVLLIKEKHYLEKALKVLEDRIKALEKADRKIGSISVEMINDALPKVYQLPPSELKKIMGKSNEELWLENALKEKKRLERKYGIRHISSRELIAKDGTAMSSKSELLIANEFIDRGIPYIYEMPVMVGVQLVRPDFTFYSISRGREIKWEHVGMLGDERYTEEFKIKLNTYIGGGLVPCVDVIFSFDSTGGSLDTRQIGAILDEYR